jgi:hypothetical protein
MLSLDDLEELLKSQKLSLAILETKLSFNDRKIVEMIEEKGELMNEILNKQSLILYIKFKNINIGKI